MKKQKKKVTEKNKLAKKNTKSSKTSIPLVLIRYLILLIITLTSLPLIYKIFTPLTTYPTKALLSLFYDVVLNNVIITINNQTFIQVIPACIAGSAYLLLLILNLTMPMNIKKRIKTILFSFATLLIINILRIFIFSIWYHNKVPFFDLTHKLFWFVLSIFFVIGVWFLTIKVFSIKEIPVYTDFKFILKSIKK